jgi:hypothetical protein
MLDVRNSCGVGVERILLPTSKRKKAIGGEEERRGMSENHTDREEEKKRKSVNVVAMVVGVPFRGASSVPLSLCSPCRSLARSLRLWMMIALELENPRIQPTRLKQSQCLDLKGGLPLCFSHIPFWDIPIHLWEWMSTSG